MCHHESAKIVNENGFNGTKCRTPSQRAKDLLQGNCETLAQIADIGPVFGSCHHDCEVSEALLLIKEKGRRVFYHQGFGGFLVFENFNRLARGANAKIYYNLEKEIKGLKVLCADDALLVKDIWNRAPTYASLSNAEKPRQSVI